MDGWDGRGKEQLGPAAGKLRSLSLGPQVTSSHHPQASCPLHALCLPDSSQDCQNSPDLYYTLA